MSLGIPMGRGEGADGGQGGLGYLRDPHQSNLQSFHSLPVALAPVILLVRGNEGSIMCAG